MVQRNKQGRMVFDLKERVWFISDQHFDHGNIMKFCNREFPTVEDMNEFLISEWNKVIGPKDTVFILGDCGMHNSKVYDTYMSRLKGRKVLINGNHETKAAETSGVFVSVSNYEEIIVFDKGVESGKQLLCLMHYPIAQWNCMERGSWMIHGHTHGNFVNYGASIDVGVDALHTYRPISYDELKIALYRKCTTNNFDYKTFKL